MLQDIRHKLPSGERAVEGGLSQFKNFKGAWGNIAEDVAARHALIEASKNHLTNIGFKGEEILLLAVLDVFIEKAQYQLTRRGWLYFSAGSITGLLAVAFMGGAAWALHAVTLEEMFRGISPDGLMATMAFAKASAVAGFAGGAALFLVGLSRAFLREAASTFKRRHAIRFGRLAAFSLRKELDVDKLEGLLKWNADFPSAFDHVETKVMTSTLQSISNTMLHMQKEMTNLVRAMRAPKSDAKSDKQA